MQFSVSLLLVPNLKVIFFSHKQHSVHFLLILCAALDARSDLYTQCTRAFLKIEGSCYFASGTLQPIPGYSNSKSTRRAVPFCSAKYMTGSGVGAGSAGPLCSPHALTVPQARKMKFSLTAEQLGFFWPTYLVGMWSLLSSLGKAMVQQVSCLAIDADYFL